MLHLPHHAQGMGPGKVLSSGSSRLALNPGGEMSKTLCFLSVTYFTWPQPIQVTRNRYAQTWLLGSLQDWVELHLIAHSNVKVNVTMFIV